MYTQPCCHSTQVERQKQAGVQVEVGFGALWSLELLFPMLWGSPHSGKS